MSFLHKIGNAIARFMYGRNGFDQLGLCTLWTSIICELLSGIFAGHAVGYVFQLGSTVFIVISFFRMLSKNLYKRRSENQRFLEKFWWPLRRKFCTGKQNVKDKEHKYFTCPACQTVCRVPKGKGKIVITCPKCGTSIKGKS